MPFWQKLFGHTVTLIEVSTGLRIGGYLIDFWGAGFDVADRVGLVPELLEKGEACFTRQLLDGWRSGRATTTSVHRPNVHTT